MDNDTKNVIAFKIQLLKTYIMGMFPKKFCQIFDDDHVNRYFYYSRGNSQIPKGKAITVSYLNKLVHDVIYISADNVDLELDDYVFENGKFKVGDIRAVANFRNEVVKCCQVPSKVTISTTVDKMTMLHKQFSMTVAADRIDITFIPRKRDLEHFPTINVPCKSIILATPYVITEEDKQIIKSTYNIFPTFDKMVSVKKQQNRLETSQMLVDAVKNI
jgi:hypothetical protein